MTVDLATGVSTEVWREPPFAGGASYQVAGQAEWSPDGARLIFNQVFSRQVYWNLASPVPPAVRAEGKTRGR